GSGPTLIADNQSAEGKAIWVFREGDFLVENIAFSGARVPDLNGAGIRFERGRMRVVRCRFTDNENGILTSNDGDSELAIEDSEVSAAPTDHGYHGHLVKSRAKENVIRYNLLYDGA